MICKFSKSYRKITTCWHTRTHYCTYLCRLYRTSTCTVYLLIKPYFMIHLCPDPGNVFIARVSRAPVVLWEVCYKPKHSWVWLRNACFFFWQNYECWSTYSINLLTPCVMRVRLMPLQGRIHQRVKTFWEGRGSWASYWPRTGRVRSMSQC